MKLSIRDNALYADNLFLCYCEAGNGRPNLLTGIFPVYTAFSHVHGKPMADASGLGWIGASKECDVVLGSVRGRDGVIPSNSILTRLLALLETAEDLGQRTELVVERC